MLHIFLQWHSVCNFTAILVFIEPLVELWFAEQPPAAVRDLSSCQRYLSFVYASPCILLDFSSVPGSFLKQNSLTWWDLTAEDEKPRRKLKTALGLFYGEDAETFITKAFSRDTQDPSAAEEVKLNPIGRDYTNIFLSSSLLSKHHKACRQASSISNSSAFLSLSWCPSPCLKTREKVTSAARCLLCLWSGLRRHKLTLRGYMKYWGQMRSHSCQL